MAYVLWLLILVPLLSSAYLALNGRRMSEKAIAKLACGAVVAAFVVAVLMFLQVYWTTAQQGTLMPVIRARGGWPEVVMVPVRPLVIDGPIWMAVGELEIAFRLLADPLSSIMALVVTGVGALIHLYARGYMHGDPHYARFFALLNLFVAMMLCLVLSENLVFMFLGWEGVGFCSYMLIGYYTERESASQAGKKAFIVNRVGDLGVLLAIILCWQHFGTLSFPAIAAQAPHFVLGSGMLVAIALLLFVGAVGKSAQFPLYVWLPDAMEGPTPVSALIHAATMVTAGVYLVVRMGMVYAMAPAAQTLVVVIALLTALMAALLALVQTDIKRVLAYSTISQLGFMFLAAGVGAYTAAIFHLATHAFFKALLFLCSGSVIHAVEHAFHHAGEHKDPQDMRNMGGLASRMPTTYGTMLVGAMAISGVPLLSGFFSKDEIIFYAGQASVGYQLIALVVSFLTAFYMFRLMAMTFWQSTRMSDEVYHHVEESPPVMTAPLTALAGLSIFGGLLNLPGEWFGARWLAHFAAINVHPLIGGGEPYDPLHGHHHSFVEAELPGMIVASVLALVAIGLALFVYLRRPELARRARERSGPVYRVLWNRYYLDRFYQDTIVKPGQKLADWLAYVFDQQIIDGFVNLVAGLVYILGEKLRGYQPGFVRYYALWFVVGATAAVALVVLGDLSAWVLWVVIVLLLVLLGAVAFVARPRDEA